MNGYNNFSYEDVVNWTKDLFEREIGVEEVIKSIISFLEAKGYKVTAPPKEVKDEYTFERAWNLYDKKVGCKAKLEKKWNSMSKKDRKAATEYIPLYVISQPDKQYRKNFQTFLNQGRVADSNRPDGLADFLQIYPMQSAKRICRRFWKSTTSWL